MIVRPEAVDRLDWMVGQVPAPDPVQVKAQLVAFMVQRGREVGTDQDLPLHLFTPEDLAELGRLDCIAKHPNLDPDLAMYLEMIAAERDRNPFLVLAKARRPDPDISPDRSTTVKSLISGVGLGRGSHLGQDDHQRRAVPETHYAGPWNQGGQP